MSSSYPPQYIIVTPTKWAIYDEHGKRTQGPIEGRLGQVRDFPGPGRRYIRVEEQELPEDMNLISLPPDVQL
jgi:hypothetical protein